MLRREYSRISANTGHAMPVVRLGDGGPALIYFPSSGGDHTEFERYGMARACAAGLAAGRMQVYAVDGCAGRTLWNDALEPAQRMGAYGRFELWAADELVPWVQESAGVERVTLVGSSFGAFVATNLLLKRPASVEQVCGLGGVYGMWHRLGGHHDGDVYFHTPLEYLPRLEDPAILHGIRQTRGIALYAGRQDEWLQSSLNLRDVLARKRLPHTLEIWPARHHETWWTRQLVDFLQRRGQT